MMEPYSEYSPAVRYGRHKLGYDRSAQAVQFFHEWIQTCAKVCPESKCGRLAEEEQANYDDWIRNGGDRK